MKSSAQKEIEEKVNEEQDEEESVSEKHGPEDLEGKDQEDWVNIPFRGCQRGDDKAKLSNGLSICLSFKSKLSQERWSCQGAFVDI